jgi:hypothetical protein
MMTFTLARRTLLVASLLVSCSVYAVSLRDTESKTAEVKHGRHLLQNNGGGGNVQPPPPPPPIIDVETSFSFASSFSMDFECVDSATWFEAGFPDRGCAQIADDRDLRGCEWIGEDGTLALESCPASCGTC